MSMYFTPTVWLYSSAYLHNVNCFVFEQSIVFHKAAVRNIYSVYYFKMLSMCTFNAVKIQSGIGLIVDALFENVTYLHNLYTVVELCTNFVLIHFGSQLSFAFQCSCKMSVFLLMSFYFPGV